MEWLGSVDCQYPGYHLGLRTPPPYPCLGWDRVKWWLDDLLVYLTAWAEDGQAISRSIYFRFFSTCCEKQPSGLLVWIWIGIWFVNKCSQTWNRHLSSPSVHHLKDSHHLFQPRSESKLLLFFQSCLDFCQVSAGIFPLFCINFLDENFCLNDGIVKLL